MSEPAVFTLDLDVPIDQIWPVIADTARFNEAIKFPRHDIEETPRADGSVEFVARAKLGPFVVVWDDEPQNWVHNRWFRHRRYFRNGPFRSLSATLELRPTSAGSRINYSLKFEPCNWIGRALLATGLYARTKKQFTRLMTDAAAFCRGERDREFTFPPPSLPRGAHARAREIAGRIEQTPYGHGLAARLADYVTTEPNVEIGTIRPLKLARVWRVPERHAIELCLEAVKTGLLNLRWDLLCPRCQVGKLSISTLKDLPDGAHCGTCNIDFQQQFSHNVELAFYPAPAVRRVEGGEYCLMGPMGTPHIKAQLTTPAAATRSEILQMDRGVYRVRTLEPGDEKVFEHSGGPLPTIVLQADGLTLEPGARDLIKIENRLDRPRTVIVEEHSWRAEALTAHRATTLQAFRDLFDDQVLRPGDDVEIESISIMFTDLRGSTALYDRIGDPQAYVLVREHFELLGAAIRECEGSIVKMIGDAIMAVFIDPSDGLRCALRIHKDIAAFNGAPGKEPLVIKLGLHLGRCISVTLNDRLDYYGTAANMAARLQGQSVGGDIVLSREFATDPAVAPMLENLEHMNESVTLKGYKHATPFIRVSAQSVANIIQSDPR